MLVSAAPLGARARARQTGLQSAPLMKFRTPHLRRVARATSGRRKREKKSQSARLIPPSTHLYLLLLASSNLAHFRLAATQCVAALSPPTRDIGRSFALERRRRAPSSRIRSDPILSDVIRFGLSLARAPRFDLPARRRLYLYLVVVAVAAAAAADPPLRL